MAFDLEEQEQIASIKAWWNQYGNLLTWLLIAALAAYAGWNGWNYYERRQSQQAGLLYEELERAVQAKDALKVQRAASDLADKFPKAAYAQMAAMAAAKIAFDAGDLKAAKSHLQWVIEHGLDDDYKSLARIRLAGILLDEKSYDEGLKVLSGEFPEAFAAAAADRKGDILFAQSKIDDARKAYTVALEKTNEKNPARQLIQLKLDAIGGSATKAAA